MATSIPPHNAAELCDAALHLIDASRRRRPSELLALRAGAGLPDRRHHHRRRRQRSPRPIATGRGGFRVRARWHKEDTGRGTWVVVVTEIPYGVPEVAADREARRAAQREEAAAARRRARRIRPRTSASCIEPRARNVDADLLMESLFRLTELESAHPAQHERAGRRARCRRCSASPRRCGNGSTIAATCWCAARATASPRSSSGSRCSAATSSPISTSTR